MALSDVNFQVLVHAYLFTEPRPTLVNQLSSPRAISGEFEPRQSLSAREQQRRRSCDRPQGMVTMLVRGRHLRGTGEEVLAD